MTRPGFRYGAARAGGKGEHHGAGVVDPGPGLVPFDGQRRLPVPDDTFGIGTVGGRPVKNFAAMHPPRQAS